MNKAAAAEMYEFGENWAEYAEHVGQIHVTRAKEEFLRLLGGINLTDKTFLDIGCGSGVHALAALESGAGHVHAMDIDPDSVKTTQNVLSKFWNSDNYAVEKASIMDHDIKDTFDIVYSWGVLHHTGDMWKAVEKAAALVKPKGHFIIALYKKTPCCDFWRWEKKLYTDMPKTLRVIPEYIYGALQCLGLLVKGRNPSEYIKSYPDQRGMRWMTDIKDWLGGYPYESASPEEAIKFVEEKGFKHIRSFNDQPAAAFGVLGTGCAEYVFEKVEE